MKIKAKLSNSDYIQISKLFSTANFNSFAIEDEERILNIVEKFRSFCSDHQDFTLRKAYSEFYKILSKKYKNEYIFKNIIFKDVILKNHRIEDCITIPEFNVGRSKADLAVFNGVSTVYEIKSEIDTTDRLPSQIADYSTFFEHLNVVTCEKHLAKVKKIVPHHVGILIIEDGKIIVEKESISNFDSITHKALFYSLRKSEYLNIIYEIYGPIPVMPNTLIFNYCFDLFKQIDLRIAYEKCLYYLKKRNLKEEQISLIKTLPPSLKCITIQQVFNKRKCENILQNLNKLHI